MRSRWDVFGGRKRNESLMFTFEESYNSLDPSQERLLHVYDALRDEIVQRQQSQERRSVRGAVAIGAIIGYAASTGVEFVVGFIPIVICYLTLESIQTHMDIGVIAKHIARIEEEISKPGSPFRYEINHGVGSERRQSFADLRFVPRISKIVFVALTYFGSITFVSEVVWPSSGVSVGAFLITDMEIWYGYFLLTVLVLLSVVVFFRNARRIQSEVAEYRSRN